MYLAGYSILSLKDNETKAGWLEVDWIVIGTCLLLSENVILSDSGASGN